MNSGLTRIEQWALLTVVGIIASGLFYQEWKTSARSVMGVDPASGWKAIPTDQAIFRPAAPAPAGPAPAALTPAPTPVPFPPAAAPQPVTSAPPAPLPPAPVSRGAPVGQTRKVDVNRASAAELETLPGIGPSLAQRIIEFRRSRPFRSPEDLIEVKGIGPKNLARLRPYVEAH